MNLGLSKDVLKDKGTIAFNISDVFNSRKRLSEQTTPSVSSDSEMQWRERQITLSFTYRFNKAKNEREKQPKRSDDGGGGDDDDDRVIFSASLFWLLARNELVCC